MSLDLDRIRAAHERIRPHITRTPVLTSSRLDEASGASLFFKCENFQKIGAFKARGATNAVFALTDATAKRGVATHSSGNHGTALARAAAHEINNPLTAVLGGLGLAARKLTPDSEEAKWIDRAREGGERIRDIVARMNRITQVEEAPQIGALPPILDIKKSSE